MRLSGIGKRFGSRTVLRDISFEIFPGTTTLLAGPNGAGKSTLLRLIAGLMPPDSGTVSPTFAGRDQLGYLGHATFVYPGLSAVENLAFWGQLHGRDSRRARLMEVLRRVDLSRFAEARAGSFSRGMAQRLNLARILLLEPQILLLDEPGTGLDSASQRMLHREIDAARERGAAVLWISHDRASDSAHADRLLLIADRRLVFDGPPQDCPDESPDKVADEASPVEKAPRTSESSENAA